MGAADLSADMVEKVLRECGAEEREAALKDVLEAAPSTSGRAADCRPVRCCRRSDLVAERRPRFTADMMFKIDLALGLYSFTNWVLKTKNVWVPLGI